MKSIRLSSGSLNKQFRPKAVAFGVAMAMASLACANPTGLSVVAGQVTAQTMGNLMQITNSPGAILNWQQFNIDAGHITQFIQQNTSSQVFNRVTGGDVSQILGTLQSNGQVFLINPAGVFFGQGAVVDTAGFLASTLATADADLLKGHLRFHDESKAGAAAGSLVNQGKLTTHSGGAVVLLAPHIENSGVIHADGEVLLAAGHSVTIVDMKHPTIGLTVAVKEGDQALNLGRMISKNASLFSHLVKNTGVVQASAAQVGPGGVIRFVAQGGDAVVGGQVLAQSTQGHGGQVDITGQRVAVLEGARVSADGATGGGTVRIGGGWQGQDSTIANAQHTVVQSNVNVSANAVVNGDGGEVVAWADGHTVINSEIQAQGGMLGGNGGRVETSGKQSLSVNKAVNTSAPHGMAGQWLIDPANLTIVDQIPAGGFNLGNSSQGLFFSTNAISSSPAVSESYLLNSTVVSGLQNNGLVQILTSGTQPGDGNLTLAAPVLISQNFAHGSSPAPTANPRLFLEAKGEISVEAAVGLRPLQTAFDGFDLFLSYDIAKPVYLDAPVYLGRSGNLILSPYEVAGGSVLPSTIPGQLPRDGVNFLSFINENRNTEPLLLNRVSIATAVATDPNNSGTLFTVGPNKPVKLNILGANLQINNISAQGGGVTPPIDIRVGTDDFNLQAPVQGHLQYNYLSARALNVDLGSSVSTFNQTLVGQQSAPIELTPHTSLDQLASSGTVNFRGGFSGLSHVLADQGTINFSSSAASSSPSFGFVQIEQLNTGPASTINLIGGNMQYGQATLNGIFNVSSHLAPSTTFLNGVDTNLNGTLNIASELTSVNLQSLGMGSGSQIQVGRGAYLGLGRAFSTSPLTFQIGPKQAGAYISSTNGQFVAQPGARIRMEGNGFFMNGGPPLPGGSSGAVLDVTGLDGRLDAPVIIESNGYSNSIVSASFNVAPNAGTNSAQTSNPIHELVIEAADIRVNAGGDGPALQVGEVPLVQPGFSGNFSPAIDVNFNGTLTVSSGRVRLEGEHVSTAGATLNVEGQNSLLELSGQFTSADLYQVNRTNGGRLAARGVWDNSAVNASNVASTSPLLKGDILVGTSDDLIVSGGVLSSADTAHSLQVAPDGFLELRGTEVATTIGLSPTSSLLLAAQDETGAATAPVVLNDAKINMNGNSFLIVESDAAGVANLNGVATIGSGHQGNLILAGRRVFDSALTTAAPDSMTLNVGSGIRLNVTGNVPSTPPGLALYYAQQGIAVPPARPVFLVGQLTPQAVAVAEYNDFEGFASPMTTVLSGFSGPSYVVDGKPDQLTSLGMNCVVNDFCVKVDVLQSLNYAGMVTTSRSTETPELADSGVVFAQGTDLGNIRFVVQTPDTIRFVQGVNRLTAPEVLSGKRLVNGVNSTIRLEGVLTNQVIANPIENNGTLDFQGVYTLSGLLSGTGTLNNSGTLVLNNSTGSVISHSIINNGTISNAGSYSLASLPTGSGTFSNSGVLNVTGSGVFGNAMLNNGAGTLHFSGGSGQAVQFSSGFSNTSNVLFNGGVFSFNNGYSQSGGSTTVQPGTSLVGNINLGGGVLRGFSTVNGNLNLQGGRLVPGASPGLMTVNGDLNLASNSTVDIEVQGNGGVQGVDFDCLVVNGTARLAGQLNLIDISGRSLGVGNRYAFLQANAITGAFGNVSKVTPVGAVYQFSDPVVNLTGLGQQLSTRAVSTVNEMIGAGSAGNTDSTVNQNLDQAFTAPPPQRINEGERRTGTQRTQQEDNEVVEAANQRTAGATLSQRSNGIELRPMRSNLKRASAVCK